VKQIGEKISNSEYKNSLYRVFILRGTFSTRQKIPVESFNPSFLLEFKIMSKLIDLQSQIANLQKQADEIRTKEFQATIVEIRQKMQAFGITVKDLQSNKAKPGRKANSVGVKTAQPAKAKKAASAVAAKYKGPNGESWTGRGLTPKWLASLVAAGGTKDQYLIAAT
jgi:DNA-binding protein H-NS